MFKAGKFIAGVLAACFAFSATAQERGPVTNLPIPRFVSMKAGEGFARRGPSKSHRIDWVYKHRNMPLMVTGEYEHWRRVQDIDGQGGWMHFRLLSGVRTVIFKNEKTPLRRRDYDGAEALAFVEQGVIGKLDECSKEWCRVFIGREKGWVMKTELWGVDAEELRD
jgi:SH3-like domain-containing protein